MRWIFWWIVNGFWMILFLSGTALVWLRKVDGAGVNQTTELKFISFAILLVAFIVPLFIQVIWLVVNIVTGNKREPNMNT